MTEDYCSICNMPKLYPDKPCPSCYKKGISGYNSYKNTLAFFGCVLLSTIFGGLLFLFGGNLLEFTSNSSSAINNTIKSFMPITLPECSDQETKNTVLEILEEHRNNFYFKNLQFLRLEDTRTEDFNEKAKKYTCQGELVVRQGDRLSKCDMTYYTQMFEKTQPKVIVPQMGFYFFTDCHQADSYEGD